MVLPGLGDEDRAEHPGDERDAEQQHRFVAEARHATRQRWRLRGRRSAGFAAAGSHRIADDAGFVAGGAGVRTGATGSAWVAAPDATAAACGPRLGKSVER